MAQYKLAGNFDPNKVFLINRSELDGRFDPIYYKMKNGLIKNFKFPLDKLGNSFFIKDGDHDKLPESAISDSINGRRYLRSQDLKANTIIDENPIYVNDEYFQCVKRCHIFPGDLLFSIMASLGATAIVPDNYPICTANRAVGILRHKNNNKLFPEFVQAIFNTNIGLLLLELEKRGAIQQRLNLSDLGRIKLPTPNYNIQKNIIQIYKHGVAQKQQKESEAKALLESIDIYLLKELGITLPEKTEVKAEDMPTWMNPENLLVKNGRLFLTKFSEVGSGRFDPVNVLNIGRKSRSTIYENTTLKVIANIKKGQSITSSEIIQGDYPVIAGGQSSPYSHNSYNNEANVITVSASGAYSGFVWYHDYPIFASDCSVIYSKDETKFSTKYIFEVLKAKQNEIYLLQQGAGQPHVYSSDLAKLLIPIITKETQDKIVKHIDSIRIQSKSLQLEAISILENAKKEVEQIILGE